MNILFIGFSGMVLAGLIALHVRVRRLEKLSIYRQAEATAKARLQEGL